MNKIPDLQGFGAVGTPIAKAALGLSIMAEFDVETRDSDGAPHMATDAFRGVDMSEKPRGAWPEGAIFTLGHSTLPIERFFALLQTYGIERLADIRTIPRSRHNPQFNNAALASTLAEEHIEYAPMPELGGLRQARKDSPNTGWRNASFRGYADYMQTEQFEDALEALIRMSREKRVAIMCAEAVPWRCHRSLVADALNARAVAVIDILSENSYRPHKLTPFARVQGMRVTYPPDQAKLL